MVNNLDGLASDIFINYTFNSYIVGPDWGVPDDANYWPWRSQRPLINLMSYTCFHSNYSN